MGHYFSSPSPTIQNTLLIACLENETNDAIDILRRSDNNHNHHSPYHKWLIPSIDPNILSSDPSLQSISQPVRPSILSFSGFTPLMLSAKNNNIAIISALLCDKRIKIDKQSPDTGRTALMYASEAGAVDAVSILLLNGANVNIRDKNGATSLLLSAWNGRWRVAELLMRAGADPCVKNYFDDDIRRFGNYLNGSDLLKIRHQTEKALYDEEMNLPFDIVAIIVDFLPYFDQQLFDISKENANRPPASYYQHITYCS